MIPMTRDCAVAYNDEMHEVAIEYACAVVLEGVPTEFALWHAVLCREIAYAPGFKVAFQSAIACERTRLAEEDPMEEARRLRNEARRLRGPE